MNSKETRIAQLESEIARLRDLRNEAESLDQRNEYGDAIFEKRELIAKLKGPKSFKAITITPSGRVATVEIDHIDSLAGMQSIVGGLIEPVDCGELTVWVNEEGLLRGYWPNARAMRFVKDVTGLDYYLVGDAIITGPEDEFGRHLSVELVETETPDDLAVRIVEPDA